MVPCALVGLVLLTSLSDPAGSSPSWAVADEADGEILLQFEPAAVLPVSVQLYGNGRERTVSLTSKLLSVSGLPSGPYQVRRVYAGGIVSSPWQVSVRDGETTQTFVRAESVGGVMIRADQPFCHAAGLEWEIRRTLPDALQDPVIAAGTSNSCEVEIAGLAPGNYTIRRVSTPPIELPIPRTHFQITSQRVSSLRIEAPATVVRGFARTGVEPLVNRELSFRGQDGTIARTTTAIDGSYVIGLKTGGTYRVRAADVATTSEQTSTPFVPGNNTYDLNLQGGSLVVSFSGKFSPDLRLFLVGPDSIRWFRIADPRNPWRLDGLPYGNYGFWASGSESASNEYHVTTLDAQRPTHTQTMTLGPHEVTLKVIDIQANPAEQTELLLSSGGESVRPIGKGVFRLHLAPGSPLVVRGVDAIACYRPTALTDQTVIILPATQRQELTFASASSIRGRIEGLGGTSCAVRLDQMEYAIRRADGGYRVNISMPSGAARFIQDEKVVPLNVPGSPVIVR
jgi:hypothetical protein